MAQLLAELEPCWPPKADEWVVLVTTLNHYDLYVDSQDEPFEFTYESCFEIVARLIYGTAYSAARGQSVKYQWHKRINDIHAERFLDDRTKDMAKWIGEHPRIRPQ